MMKCLDSFERFLHDENTDYLFGRSGLPMSSLSLSIPF